MRQIVFQTDGLAMIDEWMEHPISWKVFSMGFKPTNPKGFFPYCSKNALPYAENPLGVVIIPTPYHDVIEMRDWFLQNGNNAKMFGVFGSDVKKPAFKGVSFKFPDEESAILFKIRWF